MSGVTGLVAGLCEAAVSDGVGPALDGVRHRLVDTIGGGFAVARRVRRFWSEDKKRGIVAQTSHTRAAASRAEDASPRAWGPPVDSYEAIEVNWRCGSRPF